MNEAFGQDIIWAGTLRDCIALRWIYYSYIINIKNINKFNKYMINQ